MKKTLIVNQPYLPYPAKNEGNPSWFTLWENEKILFKFYTYLNFKEECIWYYCDMTRWMGKTITLEIEDAEMTEEDFETIQLSEKFPGYDEIYKNSGRPQFHFSFRRGILNDPNALFYYNGVYHMFVQHQPYTNEWGDWGEFCNFGWGHAISDDLVHWKELPDELIPDELGPAFSGTGLIDYKNVSGLKQGEFDPILIYYTAAGGKGIRTMHLKHTQCLVYSIDGGKSFHKYAGNPIVENIDVGNRDPKVMYHKSTGKWIMVIYTDTDEKYLFLTSDDLLHFTLSSEFKWENGEHECPNLFEIPVAGEDRNQLILSGVTGSYMAVDFDGASIQPLTKPRHINQGGSYYAAQNMLLPDGRLLSFYCYHAYTNSGFNNCIGIPNELSLYYNDGEYCLHTTPIREIEKLYVNRIQYTDIPADSKKDFPAFPLMDIEMTVNVEKSFDMEIHGVKIHIDGVDGELSVFPTTKGIEKATVRNPANCHLRLLIDRHLLCLYEENSHLIMPMQVKQSMNSKIILGGQKSHVSTMEIREMSGIWDENITK